MNKRKIYSRFIFYTAVLSTLLALAILPAKAAAPTAQEIEKSLVAQIVRQQKTLLQLIRTTSYTGKNNLSHSYVQMAQNIVGSEVDKLVDSLRAPRRNYNNKTKFFFLSRVRIMLIEYRKLYHINMTSVRVLSQLIHSFFVIATKKEDEIDWKNLMAKNHVEAQKILLHLFNYKFSVRQFKNAVVLHYTIKYPEQGIALAHQFGVDNFDTVFMLVLRRTPEVIFKDLSAANSLLVRWYSKTNNVYLNLLLRLKRRHRSNLYFPFYEDLRLKRITLEDVRVTVNYPPTYFRLMAKVHMMHEKRMAEQKDTPMNARVLTMYMRLIADEKLVTPINQLHHASDAVRYKRLQNFNVHDLYYLLVYGNENLYTSSFLYIYKSFFRSLGNKNGFYFLKELHFDGYRKFIKTLATYSYLYGKHKEDFLNTMKMQERIALMRVFVNSIPVNETYFLEDAIDVASTFTGIHNTALLRMLNAEIVSTHKKYVKEGNKKGKLVYQILEKLTHIPVDSIKSEVSQNREFSVFDAHPLFKGKYGLVEQVFFYGDDDSENSFQHLLYTFRGRKNWKIFYGENWILIRSLAGNPIRIYANLTMKGINQGYLSAQVRLKNYFLRAGMIPSIVMHRGHSYFVMNTVNNLSPHVKLVILGSCGSFGLVSRILRLSPQAHLVSTRQIGKTTINSRLFYFINEELRKNGIIYWNSFWARMQKQFDKGVDKAYFNDYIPPNKNLGAVFIKYYYSQISAIY